MSDYFEETDFRGLSDKELASEVKDGSNEAFEEIARRYVKFLYSLAYGFSADGFDKNDFAQEGLLILLAACKTYDPKSENSFKNYLAICVKRRYISLQRRSKTKGSIPTEILVPIDEAVDSADYSMNPEELLLSKERVKDFTLKAVNSLSRLEQNVLSYYIAGFTYEEISLKLGISLKSTDNALQRIRKKLST